jgi:hypothetical protein
MDIFATNKKLVRSSHTGIENIHGNVCEIRMCDPGAVVAGFDFAVFVGFDFFHGGGVGGGVVFDGNLGCHTALPKVSLCGKGLWWRGGDHCVDASFVTGFYEELDVGVHEGDSHGDVAAIWKNEFFVIAELLDETENIVLTSITWTYMSHTHRPQFNPEE